MEGASEVGVVVFERLFDGFADGFESGEVDDGVVMAGGDDLVGGGGVEEVGLVELRPDAGDLFDVVEGGNFAIRKIVENFDFVTVFDEFDGGV